MYILVSAESVELVNFVGSLNPNDRSVVRKELLVFQVMFTRNLWPSRVQCLNFYENIDLPNEKRRMRGERKTKNVLDAALSIVVWRVSYSLLENN